MAKTEKSTSREGKVYTLKSSAQRAAKEDGLKVGEFKVMESARKEGFYYIKNGTKQTKVERSEEDAARVLKEAMDGDDEPIVEHATTVESVQLGVVMEAELIKANVSLQGKGAAAVLASPAIPRTDDDLLSQRTTFKIQDYADPTTLEEKAPEVKPNEAFVPTNVLSRTSPVGGTPLKLVVPPKSSKSKSHKSTVESPTKLVWHIADDMVKANPTVSRKEVIAECERQGIAFFTARTQYQQWLTAKRESDKNAGKVGQ